MISSLLKRTFVKLKLQREKEKQDILKLSEPTDNCRKRVNDILKIFREGRGVAASVFAELLYNCGGELIRKLYEKPLLAKRATPSVIEVFRKFRDPIVRLRALSILDIASSQGTSIPLDVIKKGLEKNETKNIALSILIKEYLRNPYIVSRDKELFSRPEVVEVLKKLSFSVTLERAFKTALVSRKKFPQALAVFRSHSKNEVKAFLASKIMQGGKASLVAMRLLLALGYKVPVSGNSPEIAILKAFSGDEFKIDFDTFFQALNNLFGTMLFFSNIFRNENGIEPLRNTIFCFSNLVSKSSPDHLYSFIVSRPLFFLAVLSRMHRRELMEEFIKPILEVLAPYRREIFSVFVQYWEREGVSNVAALFSSKIVDKNIARLAVKIALIKLMDGVQSSAIVLASIIERGLSEDALEALKYITKLRPRYASILLDAVLKSNYQSIEKYVSSIRKYKINIPEIREILCKLYKDQTCGQIVQKTLEGYTVIIDVNNVIGRRKPIELETLRKIVEDLSARGVKEIVLCYDSSLPWSLYRFLETKEDIYRRFRRKLEKIVEYGSRLGVLVFVNHPAPGQSADKVVIESFNECIKRGRKCLILSNDRYKEFERDSERIGEENYLRFRYDDPTDTYIYYWHGEKV